MPELIFAAALLTIAIGSITLWVNPQRAVNRVFALFSYTVAAWIFCVFMALHTGGMFLIDRLADPVPWLRTASAVGAFFPWIVWLLKESVVSPTTATRHFVKRSLPWFGIGLALAALCYTDSFILAESLPGSPKRGGAYSVYIFSSIVFYALLLLQAYHQLLRQTGIRKIEMQFLTLNAGIGCLLVIITNGVGYFFDIRALSRLSFVFILGFYGLTAWAVTVHRVFDARQVFLSVVQRLLLVIMLSLGILGVEFLLHGLLAPALSLILSVIAGSTFAFLLERRTREWFRLTPEQSIAQLRRAMTEAARSEPSPDKLVTAYEELLRDWSQAGYARLLFDSGEVFVGGDIEFTKDRPAHPALVQSEWTTPESLQRRRTEPGLIDLRQFLTEFDLGLAVTAPRGSPTPSLVLVLGTKVNHRPFTYPEVQQVQEIAEFMDNILARSRLTRQARQSEQLATIGLLGASLAHEIRNPLVSIKTFAHLLPTRFEDPEFRRRFHVLIPAEVDRIDSLTQQLLDLSNPRRHQMERISLHVVARETIDLMLTRATEARINLVATYGATTDTIWADASAMRQVIINLLINAFQALDPQETDRRVELRTRSSPGGSVILEISDNGPGIPADQRARLFHPFVSTKTKGMGLGLAVCADILHEHKATIIVPDIGRPGATFRITFPCPPPSS
ncbi:MAG TPA: ATP-binding protein [Lacunisphaera sp.]|nr:ATP-binding protein [Lacunisphaera sp.]